MEFDNIEVLKGSQSTLYGSDAIAGVISMNTLGGVTQGIHHELDLEGGSRGTLLGRYGLKAANERARTAINVTGFKTDGISAAPGGAERDGFENYQVDGNFEARVNETISVFGSALFIDGDAKYDDYDSFSGIASDNLFNRNLTTQKAVRGGFNVDLLDGRLKNTFSAQLFEVDRAIRSVSQFGPFDADYVGNREKLDYQGSFEATSWLQLQYGADYEKESAGVTDNFGTDTKDAYSNTGFWGQASIQPVENLVLTAGLRHDENSAYGGYTTYRGTGSYLYAPTGTRLHTSFGTGFRAPSMYELYAPFDTGNESLQPETSKSFDIGIEQRFLDQRLLLDATYFYIAVEDQIQYLPFPGTFGKYQQAPGTTRSQGVELSASYDATAWLNLGGSYTYTDVENEDGVRGLRIPKHAISLSAVVQPIEKWTVSADVKVALDTVDAVGTGQVDLDDYVLVNAKVAYKYSENLELYARGTNLLDQNYQTAKGFDTPGISGFAGIKLRY